MWSTSFHLYDSEAASVLAHITLAADELKTKKTATTHHTISSDNVVSKDTILQPGNLSTEQCMVVESNDIFQLMF